VAGAETASHSLLSYLNFAILPYGSMSNTSKPSAERNLNVPSNLVSELNKNQYVIVDNFIELQWADRLLSEGNRLVTEGHLKQHLFQFGNTLYEKPNIFELDLHDQQKREQSSELSYIFEKTGPAFIRAINEQDTESRLCLDQSPSAIKLQHNRGGCFPLHYDNPGQGKRAITCIVYLNPHWIEGDGGELVLWPFLAEPILVPPLHRRAVIFKSDMLLHRVMQTKKERFCFTIWCDGATVNGKDDVFLSRDHLKFSSFDEAELFFANSPLQRVISRAVYDEEYLASLIECLGGTDGARIMIYQHRASVQSLVGKLRPLIEEFQRRKASCLRK
jgi:hypothetical protein